MSSSSGISSKSNVDEKLNALNLILPQPIKAAPGMKLPPCWIRIRGNRAYISGHGPQNPDGSMAGPLGKVGTDVTIEQANQAARLATLSILATIKRELGSLERVTAWLVVNGFINVANEFSQTTEVINGCSELILELYGPEAGQHARTAIGVATTPFELPVIISAEVEINSNIV